MISKVRNGFVILIILENEVKLKNGGPGYESTVIEFLIYLKAFRSNQLGYACALAVILFFIVLVISKLQMKAFLKPEDWRE